jgi:hypothetical protein
MLTFLQTVLSCNMKIRKRLGLVVLDFGKTMFQITYPEIRFIKLITGGFQFYISVHTCFRIVFEDKQKIFALSLLGFGLGISYEKNYKE